MPHRPARHIHTLSFAQFMVAIMARLIALFSQMITSIREGAIEPPNKKNRVRKKKNRRVIVDTHPGLDKTETVPASDDQRPMDAGGSSALTETTWSTVSSTRNKKIKRTSAILNPSVNAVPVPTTLSHQPSFFSSPPPPFVDDEPSVLSSLTKMDDSISTLTVSASELSVVPSLTPVSEFRLVEINRRPPCYDNNSYLRLLLDRMSDLFIHSECEGYVFGSTNYKKMELPHDFDVVLVNIKSNQDRANVDALIQSFKRQGGVVTATDERGTDGYRTGNRHVIPMEWKQWKIDFIVSASDIIDHSRQMDFTVGALYFNLRQKKMYRVAPFTTLKDLNRKRICTITDPLVSFAQDPSRIFRAVRLMASEKFHLSIDCDNAIRTLFAGDKNPLNDMKVGKFFQQLNLLFSSGHEAENLAILYHLGLFFKLFSRVHELARQGGYRYASRLQPYYDGYTCALHSPAVYSVPYIVPGYFFVPYSSVNTESAANHCTQRQSAINWHSIHRK